MIFLFLSINDSAVLRELWLSEVFINYANLMDFEQYWRRQRSLYRSRWQEESASNIVDLKRFEELEDPFQDIPSMANESASDNSEAFLEYSKAQELVKTFYPPVVEDLRQAKIEELSLQVERLQLANKESKKERDDLLRRGRVSENEMLEQNKFTSEEMTKIKREYELEVKRMQRDRKLWEKQKLASDILPTKRYIPINFRERQEVDLLHVELKEQAELFKAKEIRMTGNNERLKKKVLELEKRTRELSDEVLVLERERSSLASKITQIPLSTPKITKSIALKELNRTTPKGKQIKAANRVSVIMSKPPDKAWDKLEHDLSLKGGIENNNERVYDDGSKIIKEEDGTMKLFYRDGRQTSYYINGDTKRANMDGSTVYWYSSVDTRKTNYADGLEICEFASGQIETKYPDGSFMVHYPDSTQRTILSNGVVPSSFNHRLRSSIQMANLKRLKWTEGFRFCIQTARER